MWQAQVSIQIPTKSKQSFRNFFKQSDSFITDEVKNPGKFDQVKESF